MATVGLQARAARLMRNARSGIALATLVATFVVLQPAVAAVPSTASRLAHLRADIRAAVNAQRHHKRLSHDAYQQIRELARKLEARLKKGSSPCRTSLSAAQRLAGERGRAARLKADLRRAQSGLPKCPAVLLIPSPAAPTDPTDNPPVAVVQAFTSETQTRTVNTTGFAGTETDESLMTSNPAPGDPAECTGSTCVVQLEYTAGNGTTDITASNNLPEPDQGPACSYSDTFAMPAISPIDPAQLKLQYNDDGKLTSAEVLFQYEFGVGSPPAFGNLGSADAIVMFSCIALAGSSPEITEPVNAATLSEGKPVNVDISDSGSAVESGYYGDGANLWEGGKLSGELSYSNTTHITFEIKGSR